MIKLIKNELIKIFKRKSIYVLFSISIVIITIYNYINPDQNENAISMDTLDINISVLEDTLNEMIIGTDEYIEQKTTIDFCSIYNKYEENSWQRLALNDERKSYSIDGVNMNFDYDITNNLRTINDYELNDETSITEDEYINSEKIIKQFIEILDENTWKEFIELKIDNLKKQKELNDSTYIDVLIETYELRLNNSIQYSDNILNKYIDAYKESSFLLLNSNNDEEKESYETKKALSKYAIENNIEQDISTDTYYIIYDNEVDSRIAFLRTFTNFNILIVVIIIYIACTIVTEEYSRKTIKSLLIKPHKKSEIITSKFFACIITTIISVLIILVSQYIIGGLIFGFNGYQLGFIGYNINTQSIINMNIFNFMLLVGLGKLPMYIMIVIFCMTIGTINNNLSMSVILTTIIFIFCSTALYEWSKLSSISVIAKFFITNNWDFSNYLFGRSVSIDGINIMFSTIVYFIYFILLSKLMLSKFNRKEIL